VGVLFSYLTSNLRRQNQVAIKEIAARKKSEAELIEYRDHLEELVQQRTSELEKVNSQLRDEISEHKKDEEALRQSEERWATTLASIGDGVIATDVSGRVSFMNTVAQDLTGWKTGEAIQKPIAEVFNIINETTRQKAENPVDKVLQLGIICSLANHTILTRKDGMYRRQRRPDKRCQRYNLRSRAGFQGYYRAEKCRKNTAPNGGSQSVIGRDS
jgi:PAS domain S-box-containing protein